MHNLQTKYAHGIRNKCRKSKDHDRILHIGHDFQMFYRVLRNRRIYIPGTCETVHIRGVQL